MAHQHRVGAFAKQRDIEGTVHVGGHGDEVGIDAAVGIAEHRTGEQTLLQWAERQHILDRDGGFLHRHDGPDATHDACSDESSSADSPDALIGSRRTSCPDSPLPASIAAAKPASVGCSKTIRGVIANPASRARAAICTARMLSPPSMKKSSERPTSSTPSRCSNSVASARSVSEFGGSSIHSYRPQASASHCGQPAFGSLDQLEPPVVTPSGPAHRCGRAVCPMRHGGWRPVATRSAPRPASTPRRTARLRNTRHRSHRTAPASAPRRAHTPDRRPTRRGSAVVRPPRGDRPAAASDRVRRRRSREHVATNQRAAQRSQACRARCGR